ncbi:hypothetical protein IMG5_004210 [Ichthyophthirius multifiliis]|uniref:EF-hand domain-containing protein n=1 Tax=Ichthyophthirius multifiliis TaxID=5932 RepID=G0QJD3_ICHMU|nr:hypothetical protein IMG5_004210 [Ichthyophthirius multifiliis]EGR34673.1 hypothetical protein IMG5_004210 [Ichthyophthirius multifiliis]|eukprot:XP_004039977.1 hypothetical protein IMG5_004210 [Ichthyophthirius multifiliis]
MGIVSSTTLSSELKDKIMSVFKRIDKDGSKQSNFAKVNTDALFKAVDVDNSGTITEDEWLQIWITVKESGHSEQEIEEELENLLLGFSWVYFDKNNK